MGDGLILVYNGSNIYSYKCELDYISEMLAGGEDLFRGKGFESAYSKWSPEEDKQLIEEFNQGLTIKQMANIHKRKRGGIRSRLKKHKLIK